MFDTCSECGSTEKNHIPLSDYFCVSAALDRTKQQLEECRRDLRIETQLLYEYKEKAESGEERGRRRGVEELRTLATAKAKEAEDAAHVEGWHGDAQMQAYHAGRRTAYASIIDAALAPRDSAPVCDAVLSSDPFREWRCGKPKDHEGPHSGDRK